MKRLEKSIGYLTGTSYCVTIIIGAGILGLPGVAAKAAGANSVHAWLVDFLLAIPLLVVFSKLTLLVQSAGGVADFVSAAFGKGTLYRFAQMLLILTLIAGTAAIALVGAQYLGDAVGWSRPTVGLVAALLILTATTINTFGIKVGGALQNVVAASLIIFLFVVIGTSMPQWKAGHVLAVDATQMPGTWTAMGLLWFAFTGIEMISFLGEEFKSPRTFVLSVVTAFGVIGILYLGLAVAVKEVVAPDDPLLSTSPLVAVVNRTVGASFGKWGGAFGFLLILINLNGAILGASRLVYSVARDGLFLPTHMASLSERGVPWLSLWSLSVASVASVAVITTFSLPLASVFLIVSQHWFILYVLAIFAFLRLRTSRSQLIIGVVALALAAVFMRAFSWYLVIPLGVLVLARLKNAGGVLNKRINLSTTSSKAQNAHAR